MKIIADESIIGVDELFSDQTELITLPFNEINTSSIKNADCL